MGKGSLSRRQSRRKAFELLYEMEHREGLDADAILKRTFDNPDVAELFARDEDSDGYVAGIVDDGARLFISELVSCVCEHKAELDEELSQYPHDWSYDRIGAIERVLLKLALAEMVYIGTSYKVVINEALDMAKIYAQEDASKFINGILGAAVRKHKNLESPGEDGELTGETKDNAGDTEGSISE